MSDNPENSGHQQWASLNGDDLPSALKPLFREYDFGSLSWERDGHFITKRVLTHGGFSAWSWLRDRIGDAALREWIVENNGAGMDPRRLRYWELILDLPHQEVDRWVSLQKDSLWGRRIQQLPGSAA